MSACFAQSRDPLDEADAFRSDQLSEALYFRLLSAMAVFRTLAEIQAQGIGHAQVPRSAAMHPPWRTRGQSVKRRPSGPDRSHAHVRSPEDSEDQPWMRCWGLAPQPSLADG
jgi:hypothetical protein